MNFEKSLRRLDEIMSELESEQIGLDGIRHLAQTPRREPGVRVRAREPWADAEVPIGGYRPAVLDVGGMSVGGEHLGGTVAEH